MDIILLIEIIVYIIVYTWDGETYYPEDDGCVLNSNSKNQIPKKYHWSVDNFSLDVYDTLLYSSVPFINTRIPDRLCLG